MKTRYELFDAVLYFSYAGLALLVGGLLVA
jgi:hypothetical protein